VTLTTATGSSVSTYGFTGEYTSNNLVYLRARQYAPSMGRFLTQDTWGGDANSPMSFNRWMYVQGNPINATDPSGYITKKESSDAMKILRELKSKYNINIPSDWGYRLYTSVIPEYIDETLGFLSDCQWTDGSWRNLKELQLTRDGIEAMATKMGGAGAFLSSMFGPVTIRRMPDDYHNNDGKTVAWTILDVKLYNGTFNDTDDFARGTVVHELAHVWDTRQFPIFRLSTNMISKTKSFKQVCDTGYNGNKVNCRWIYDQSSANLEQSPTPYGQSGPREDFADTFAICVYPGFKGAQPLSNYSIRKDYIEGLLKVFHGNKCS